MVIGDLKGAKVNGNPAESDGGDHQAQWHAPHGPEKESSSAHTVDKEDGKSSENPIDTGYRGTNSDGVVEPNNVEEGRAEIHESIEPTDCMMSAYCVKC